MILVDQFNCLPRPKFLHPTDQPNSWHISIRRVPSRPPGYFLFITHLAYHPAYEARAPGQGVNLECEPLPPAFATSTIEAKAATIAPLLLQAFDSGLVPGRCCICRPWSWVCEDAKLVGALGERLTELEISHPKFVGVALEEENMMAEDVWKPFFAMEFFSHLDANCYLGRQRRI